MTKLPHSSRRIFHGKNLRSQARRAQTSSSPTRYPCAVGGDLHVKDSLDAGSRARQGRCRASGTVLAGQHHLPGPSWPATRWTARNGAQSVARACCSTLGRNEILDLGGTHLGNPQLGLLTAALQAHGKLTYLGLGDNDFCWTDRIADEFMAALSANRSLTHLVLPRPGTMPDDFDAWGLRMLETNTTLTELEPYDTPGEPREANSSRAFDVRMKLAQNRFDRNRRRGDACDLSIRPAPRWN